MTLWRTRLLVRRCQFCVSQLLCPGCRLHSNCSQYALQVLQSHGAVKSSWLALRHVLLFDPRYLEDLYPVPIPKTTTLD
nr:membrane protein insertion efficiency factor YidD [Comamonas koreensis]